MTAVAGATEGRTTAMVAELVAAVGFLTRLPLSPQVRGLAGERTGAAAFGLVGTGIGALGALPLVVFGGSLPVLAALLALAFVAVLTGAFHLDGLADTADALVAPTPDAAERARRDPRAGPAGIVAIVLVLGLEVAVIATLATASASIAGLAVVAAAAGSRAVAPVVALVLDREPRGDRVSGERILAGWFAMRVAPLDVLVALGSALVVALVGDFAIGGGRLAVGTTISIALGIAAAAVLRRLRHGLDGDGYGATIEITFAATLVAIAVQVV